MTDSEKLNLILSKLDSLDSETQDMKKDINALKGQFTDSSAELKDMKKDINALKSQLINSTSELKAMDEIILDEVERVHSILDRHKADKTVHTT